MSISFGLGVNLGQSQKLTPQMQQAIRLLQLSNLELAQEVQAKLESNPLLERIDDGDDWDNDEIKNDGDTPTLDDWTGNQSTSTSDDTEPYEDSLDKIASQSLDDGAMDMQWQEVYGDDVLDDGYQSDYGNGYVDETLEPLGATSLSIQDHIRWQMNFKHLSDLDTLIAEQLIDAMDDKGFIRVSLADITNHFATLLAFYELDRTVELDEVQAVLTMIQSCHPTGVGARDLGECLLIQLRQLPQNTPYLDEAVQVLHHSEYLQSNQIAELIKATKLSTDDIKQAIALIRTLNPNPADEFILSQELTQGSVGDEPQIPDILVIAKDNNNRTMKHVDTKSGELVASWRVLLNPETLPKLQINQEYASLIKRGDDSEDNRYLKTHLQDARSFIRSIDERNQNLLKVASCVVAKQQAFLLSGTTAMRPLTLKEVADEVGLHESSVSRLTTNKLVLTPQGLLDFKYFFSSQVQSDDGGVSSTAIGAMIAQMIANEDPKKPLSDSKITNALVEQGIDVARRTVAKYRETMGILSSSERKKKL